ncbi:MAG: hypothetical protein LBS29_04945 [Endomicrobium sp.]|nr:hypothetical protein [Endomicrobium sp.]
MLVYSDTRYVPTYTNTMVLEDKFNKYFYIHRSLYDQAVVLYDLYNKDIGMLRNMIAGTFKKKAALYFYENAPVPINILGLFLDLLDSMEELEEDLEVLSGIIHVISTTLDFRKLLKVDMQIRLSVRFSMSILNEYSLSWHKFFTESFEYDKLFKESKEMIQETNEPVSEELWEKWNDDIDFSDILNPVEEKVEVEVEEVEVKTSGLDVLKGW